MTCFDFQAQRQNRFYLFLLRHTPLQSVCLSTWSECLEAAAQSSPHAETLWRGPETTRWERSLPCPHHTHRPTSLCPRLFQLHRLTAAKTLPEPASESPSKAPPNSWPTESMQLAWGGHFLGTKVRKILLYTGKKGTFVMWWWEMWCAVMWNLLPNQFKWPIEGDSRAWHWTCHQSLHNAYDKMRGERGVARENGLLKIKEVSCAWVPQLLKPVSLMPVLHNERSHCDYKPNTATREKPVQQQRPSTV